MRRDYINIGPSPCGEDCAQLGSDGYAEKARKECNAFREQLRRQFGPEPEGAELRVKGERHDFGTYYEVVCYFWDNNEKAMEYAFKLEGETPELWDAEAKAALGL